MSIAVLALLLAIPQAAPSTAAERADQFQLDLNGDEQPGDPPPPAAEKAPAEVDPTHPFSLDTPIAELVANWRSKAVLDRNLPGLTVDRNIDKIAPLSLRKLAPLSGGRLSEALLEKTGKDLAAIELPAK